MAATSEQSLAQRIKAKATEGKMETAGMSRWLLTYADMITLLLALFIILFAISTISKVKLQRLAREISAGFNNIDAINNPPNGGSTGSEQGSTDQANLAALQQQLDRYIKDKRLQSKVQTKIDRRGLVVTLLSDKAYYDSGSAQLRPEAQQLLDQIGSGMKKIPTELRVEGYTDNVPIATSSFPTNWELSAARATNVTRYLVEHDGVSPERISLAGYGEYRPKYPNDNDAHRQQNRRVDIVIINPGGANKSPDSEAAQ